MSLVNDREEGRLTASAGVGPFGEDGQLSVLAALAALVAAGLALASTLSGGAAAIGLIGLSGVFLLAFVGVVLLRLRRREARSSGREAFIALLDDVTEPSFLADANGVVNAANDAAGGLPGPRTGAIADRLDGVAADGAALVYRLSRTALANGVAEESAAAADGGVRRIRALRISADRLLWSVGPAAPPADDVADEAGFAHVRLTPDGRVAAANKVFDHLGDNDRAALVSAAVSAIDAGAGHGVASLSSGPAEFAAARGPAATEVYLASVGGPPQGPNVFFDELPVALAQLSATGEVISVNEAARALLGVEAAPGCAFASLVEGLGRPIEARIAEALAGRGGRRSDLTRGSRKDREVYLRVAFSRVEVDGAPALVAVINDATELRTLEQQFVQSQKMQAVGQLAGGVAHDFNNLLTAILGHCDLMSLRRDETDPDFEDLTQIRQNANRAAALVRQLLAFSRQQKLNPKSCALPDTLGELSHLLNRLIGEKVTLDVSFEPGLWAVWIDERQFEQVILNLVVNARDAMPRGGEIAIACHNERLDEDLKRDRAVVPAGDYVMITVSDEGEGMSDETKAKVFEPFFTTKAPGEGTGLGLSTAYGIVKQTGGFIFIDSTPGEGATFRILFPRLMNTAATAVIEEEAGPKDLTGAGRILLVEDEAPVRTFARRALTLRGYDVVEAENAEAALAYLDEAKEKGEVIDLVVSDVMMPGLDGPTWVREARKTRPDLAVIFTSGYAEDVFRKGLSDLGNCGFLPKPFTLEDLGAAVKAKLTEAKTIAAPVS